MKGTKKFDKVIFDGKIAAENPDALFVMPTHPLVKQAIASFEHDPVTCVLKTKNKDLLCGKYPFLVYEKALEHSIEEQIRNATDVKILRMKKSELEAKRTVYAEKMDALNALIGQADIVAKKLVEGVLIIEE